MFRRCLLVMMLFGVGMGTGVVVDRLAAASGPPVKVENLLRSDLQVSGELEVIVSLVEIAAGTSLPKHHHPGEEFVYVIEGSSTLWQEGKADTVLNAGDAYRIPLEQVHTAMTGEQAAKAIVFRVHRKGMPDRIPQ